MHDAYSTQEQTTSNEEENLAERRDFEGALDIQQVGSFLVNETKRHHS